jgi:hypothetical protein
MKIKINSDICKKCDLHDFEYEGEVKRRDKK